MAGHKIIFVSQEITPYLSETDNASWGRSLPQAIQQRKYEVRTFMPDFGAINERRNQLHEVIRLSGMNIPIRDNDHPLVIKVASMQPARIQVYFIDNDDYFQKSADDVDAFGSNRSNNDERMIFFSRGMVETARKLQWDPEIIQLSGWFSSLIPLYIRDVFADAPAFSKTGIVFTFRPFDGPEHVDPAIFDKLIADGVSEEALAPFREMPCDAKMLAKMAIAFSDAVVFQGVDMDPELVQWCQAKGKQWSLFQADSDQAAQYDILYKNLMSKS